MPVELSLHVRGFVYKDGDQWVAECPALRIAAQGASRRAARSELEDLIGVNIDMYHQRGVLDEVLSQAAMDPTATTVRRSKPKAEPTSLAVRVPFSMVASRNVEKAQRLAA